MEFIDLKLQYKRIEKEILKTTKDVLTSGEYIMGSKVNVLEQRLADYVGTKHCICVSSGTDALLVCLMALGIKKGDAVFVPSFTFFATAEVVALLGAYPVFCDVNEKTFTLDTNSLEQKIDKIKREGKYTPKAVIPVDLFGLCCDYDEINKVCEKNNLYIVEDGAQGFGGSYKGKRACSFGDMATTSFFPAKPLGCYGDGGAIFCNNDNLCEISKSIRFHGKGTDKYNNVRIGLNARLDTLQAGILLCKMDIFDSELARKNQVAKAYTKYLQKYAKTPFIPDDLTSSFAQYTICLKTKKERDNLRKELDKRGIPSNIYYPIPLHMQEVFKDIDTGTLPVCEKLSETVLSLPMHPYLENNEIEFIAKEVILSLNTEV